MFKNFVLARRPCSSYDWKGLQQNNENEKIMSKNYAVNPYLFFTGRCQEAIAFYRKTIGAEPLMVMHYKDAPPGAMPPDADPANANKVIHARLSFGGATIMMSDGPGSGKYDGFALSLPAPDAAEAERLFKALSEGGRVDMPLGKTFFSPAFGMLTDRFGIKWMVMVEAHA
jgi:PhnB protein